MEGKIKFFKQEKGYGFITDNNCVDYFFHISKSINIKETYQVGDKVIFDGKNENGKNVAFRVAKLKEEKKEQWNIPVVEVIAEDDMRTITIGQYERENRFNSRVQSSWSLFEKRDVIHHLMDGWPLPYILTVYSNLEYSLIFGNHILAAIEGFVYNEFDWNGKWYSKEGYPCLESWEKRKFDSVKLEFKILHSSCNKEQLSDLKQQYQNLLAM